MSLCDVAFTGTREDPSAFQLMMASCVLTYLWRIGYRRFHFGDCVGADAAVAELARSHGYLLVAHPPDNPTKRAYVPADEKHEPLPYLHRNQVIVSSSSMGLATPLTDTRTAHSGSWSTIAAMKARGIPHFIVGPTVMRRVDA
jgi:hypothetical protein